MKLKLQTLVVAALVACSLNTSAQKSSNAKNNPKAYAPFDLGELKPEGWLKEWAQKAARGMTRTIGIEFTEFVRGWGDPNQGGCWHYEQTAYYTDGFTRLGFLLDDTLLINRSRRVMEAVVARQKPNGYIHSNNKDYVLPENVVKEKISAKVENGVLSIVMPKQTKEEEKKSQLQIEVK